MCSRERLVLWSKTKAKACYKLHAKDKLGEGSFGVVVKAKYTLSGEVRAFKKASKTKETAYMLRKEAQVMASFDHPGICRLFEVIEDKTSVCFVMELCAGGDLQCKLKALAPTQSRLEEKHAAGVLRQLFCAVHYIHERHVAHADLAARNVLLGRLGPIEGNLAKLADFGSAKSFDLAAEAGPHRGDLWSMGLIMRGLVCDISRLAGSQNSTHSTSACSTSKPKLRLNKAAGGKDAKSDPFHPDAWIHASPEARCLCGRLLRRDPLRRWTAEEALHHPWFENMCPRGSPAGKFAADTSASMRRFVACNQLQQVALQAVADQLSRNDAFTALDIDGDGLLTPEDLRAAAEVVTVDPDSWLQLLRQVDPDGIGAVEAGNFAGAMLCPENLETLSAGVLNASFRVMDRDGDGLISLADVKHMLHSSNDEEILALLAEADLDRDGSLNSQEFSALIQARPNVATQPETCQTQRHDASSVAIAAKFRALEERYIRTVDDDDDGGSSCADSSIVALSSSHAGSDGWFDGDEDEDDFDYNIDEDSEDESPKLDILGNPCRSPKPKAQPKASPVPAAVAQDSKPAAASSAVEPKQLLKAHQESETLQSCSVQQASPVPAAVAQDSKPAAASSAVEPKQLLKAHQESETLQSCSVQQAPEQSEQQEAPSAAAAAGISLSLSQPARRGVPQIISL
eukprot:TRINITY_DN1375_c0_g1_i1.p1 TRINITY_DN1375_c0_g1~~TRINITY_DN1375_c0_g1_i1.p1  ORF type:complete len:685 (+),score=157.40 TRINITY_DN1375_c0_g1_i1:61-2115(+)